MRTFQVSEVKPETKPRDALDRGAAIAQLLSAKLEQVYASTASLVACTDISPLVQMAHDAFYEHRPIALSPDAIWFTIAQGFAAHVHANAERLRHRFVKHEGKVKLVVERPDFVLGQSNPWPEAFTAFSDQIARHVGKVRDLVVADFSTTGPLERAATEVVLMDTFQAYFEYVMMIGCGIPSVTLLGTPDDWRSIRRRAQMLSEFGLEHWTDALLPVLDRVVATADGADDPKFWQSFFHYESGSMGAALTGWIHVLFPYIKIWNRDGYSIEPNPYVSTWERAYRAGGVNDGPALRSMPSGLASAPVELTDMHTGSTHEMRFVAGMFGVVEDAGGVLAPEFGWAVTYDGDGVRSPDG
jgi:uncharacterized protein DUF4419